MFTPGKKFLFVCLCVLSFKAHSQNREGFAVGISAGMSNYSGELSRTVSLNFTRPGFGAYAMVRVIGNSWLRIGYFHGYLYADETTINRGYARALNFRADVDELSGIILYPVGFNRSQAVPFIQPYLFAGVAAFRFTPEGRLNGEWYELQPIGTEGQHLSSGDYPEPYKLNQYSIPFGIGGFFRRKSNLGLGLEIGFRKTFTDYLDDVSGFYPDKSQLHAEQGATAVFLSDPSTQGDVTGGKPSFSKRGNPNTTDWYAYSNVNLTWYFSKGKKKGYQKNIYESKNCGRFFR